MIEEIRAFNAKLPKPYLVVGDEVQTSYYDTTRNKTKHGFHKPCKVLQIEPCDQHCHTGWWVTVQWPDGQILACDSGWFVKPKHTPKKPAQFEFFQ